MKYAIWLVASSGLLLASGCASDRPYPAPADAQISLLPAGLSISGSGGVMNVDAVVFNSESGKLYNNVLVTVKSAYQGGVILVPETAILSYNSETDSDWQVASSEWYYQFTNVAVDDIQPDYLDIATDSRGIARVYLYFRCLPMTCNNIVFSSCLVDECRSSYADAEQGVTAGGNTEDVANIPGCPNYDMMESCKYTQTSVYFSTGYSSAVLEIDAKAQ